MPTINHSDIPSFAMAEIEDTLKRLSDEFNPISEHSLEVMISSVDMWLEKGWIEKELASFLIKNYTKIATQSRVIRSSAERLSNGEWKSYNKFEGL